MLTTTTVTGFNAVKYVKKTNNKKSQKTKCSSGLHSKASEKDTIHCPAALIGIPQWLVRDVMWGNNVSNHTVNFHSFQ